MNNLSCEYFEYDSKPGGSREVLVGVSESGSKKSTNNFEYFLKSNFFTFIQFFF